MSSDYHLMDKNTEIDDASPDNADGDDSLRTKNDDFLAKASMTESYSEILNSPIAETNDGPIESNAPIFIAKRRPSSLTRHHSSQCKFKHWANYDLLTNDTFRLLDRFNNGFLQLSASFPHGSVRVDESNMTHFVADNLEYKIKTASPKDGKIVCFEVFFFSLYRSGSRLLYIQRQSKMFV